MHGQPAGARLGSYDPVGDAGGEEGPVSGTEGLTVTVDLHHPGPRQHYDPLVVVLQVVLRQVVLPAQDVFDSQAANGKDRVYPLTSGRRVRRRTEAPERVGRRND